MHMTLTKSKVSEQVKSLMVHFGISFKPLLSTWRDSDQLSLTYTYNYLSYKENVHLLRNQDNVLKRTLISRKSRLKSENLKSQEKLESSMKSSLKWTINIERKWQVFKSSTLKKSENFSFARQNLENQILSLVCPKMENFIPLETILKVLKVPRRHFSKIPNR